MTLRSAANALKNKSSFLLLHLQSKLNAQKMLSYLKWHSVHDQITAKIKWKLSTGVCGRHLCFSRKQLTVITTWHIKWFQRSGAVNIYSLINFFIKVISQLKHPGAWVGVESWNRTLTLWFHDRAAMTLPSRKQGTLEITNKFHSELIVSVRVCLVVDRASYISYLSVVNIP